MACLNNEQIEIIRSTLKSRKGRRSFLFEEWAEQVACDVESLMNRGMSFEDAFGAVIRDAGYDEISSARSGLQPFMNNRYMGINKILMFAFLAFAASWILNLQGSASWIGLGSFLILGLVILRISQDFYRKRFIHRINILSALFGFLSFLALVSGLLLIFLNRNYGISTRGHGVDLTIFAWFFFSLTCLIYYNREYQSAFEDHETKKMIWFYRISGFNLFLAAISIASFPLYRFVQGYLFFLILFILGFSFLVLLILFFTGSMKNTLMLSLVITSFMIVFIHSNFRNKLPGGKPKLHEFSLQVIPGNKLSVDKLFITMYYDHFPDKPISLPLQKTGNRTFELRMPSYSYNGYLFYTIMRDSVDALLYFSQPHELDSVKLSVPHQKIYQLVY